MDTEQTVVQPSEVSEPAGGDKLDQIINSAIDTVEAAESPPGESQQEKAERSRDERGRFASKEPAEAQPSDKEPAQAEANPAEATTDEPAPQPLDPHPRWNDADKAKFATLPRDVQEFLLAREKATEGDYTRKTQELAEQRKGVEPLLSAVGQWSPYLQSIGLTPEVAFAQLLQTEQTLRTGTPEQKAHALGYLAQFYGIDLPNQNSGEGAQATDPHMSTLVHQVSTLTQELNNLRQQQALAESQKAEAEVANLASSKDENGQPKFPHFERVRQTMGRLVQSGQAATFEDAYSKAVRLDDDLHKEIIEAAAKREREALEKARQEAVEKANKAKPVRTSNSSPHGEVAKRGLDALLDSALSQHGIA